MDIYEFSPENSDLRLFPTHAGINIFTLHFRDYNGIIKRDPENPENTEIEINISAGSLDSGMKGLNDFIVKEKNLLDANLFPEIHVKSKKLRGKPDDKNIELITNLTIKEKTNEVTFYLTRVIDILPDGEKVENFNLEGEIDLSEFGFSSIHNFPVGMVLDKKLKVKDYIRLDAKVLVS